MIWCFVALFGPNMGISRQFVLFPVFVAILACLLICWPFYCDLGELSAILAIFCICILFACIWGYFGDAVYISLIVAKSSSDVSVLGLVLGGFAGQSLFHLLSVSSMQSRGACSCVR